MGLDKFNVSFAGADTINRQAVICHRVLRTLQQVAQTSQILTQDTWESLLLFLLASEYSIQFSLIMEFFAATSRNKKICERKGLENRFSELRGIGIFIQSNCSTTKNENFPFPVNEVLLAPPIIKDDVGDQLCERVLSVLFEVWLLACVRCFPSPSLWKTLQESCFLLRHRIALIEQWNRVNIALTARLLEFTYGSLFPELKICKIEPTPFDATLTISFSFQISGRGRPTHTSNEQ